jgi:hypothetical protein
MKKIVFLFFLLSALCVRAQVPTTQVEGYSVSLAQSIMLASEKALTATAEPVGRSPVDSLPFLWSYPGIAVVLDRQSNCRSLVVFIGDTHWQIDQGDECFEAFDFDSCQVTVAQELLTSVLETLRPHLWCGPKWVDLDQVISSTIYQDDKTYYVVSALPELDEILELADTILSVTNKTGVERIAMGSSQDNDYKLVYLPEQVAIIITSLGQRRMSAQTSSNFLMTSQEHRFVAGESEITLGDILELREKLARNLQKIRGSQD